MASSGFNPSTTGSMAGGALGAGVGSFMAPWQNPGQSASPWMDQIPGALNQYLSPYINAGQQMLPGLQNQYNMLMNDPGGRLNQIGAGYHQSPGFQFALQQALQGAGHAAAAGGMAGSPQHEQQAMGVATGLADQDYNQWLGNALGMYQTGLSGGQNIYNTGAQTGMSMGEDMASYLANRAKLSYESQNADNQHGGGMWGSLMGGLGTAAGGIMGGPIGSAIGKKIGGWF